MRLFLRKASLSRCTRSRHQYQSATCSAACSPRRPFTSKPPPRPPPTATNPPSTSLDETLAKQAPPRTPWAYPIPANRATRLHTIDAQRPIWFQRAVKAATTLLKAIAGNRDAPLQYIPRATPNASPNDVKDTYIRNQWKSPLVPSMKETVDKHWLEELQQKKEALSTPNSESRNVFFHEALNKLHQNRQSVKQAHESNTKGLETTKWAIVEGKKEKMFFYPASSQFPYVTLGTLMLLLSVQGYTYFQLNRIKRCRNVQTLNQSVEDALAFVQHFELESDAFDTHSDKSLSTSADSMTSKQATHQGKEVSVLKLFASAFYVRDPISITGVKWVCYFVAGTFLERLWGSLLFGAFLFFSTAASTFAGYYASMQLQQRLQITEVPFQSTAGGLAACVASCALFYPKCAVWRNIPVANRFLVSPFLVFFFNGFSNIVNFSMNKVAGNLAEKEKHRQAETRNETVGSNTSPQETCTNEKKVLKTDSHGPLLYRELIRMRLLVYGCEMALADARHNDLHEPRDISRLAAASHEKLKALEEQWDALGIPDLHFTSELFSFLAVFLVVSSVALKQKFFRRF